MVEKIIVGRDKYDATLLKEKGVMFIGRHIVGKGNDSHLTNPIFMDAVRPHIVLVCGKRGSGKCVTGDTLVTLSDGSLTPIKNLKDKETYVFGIDSKLKVAPLKKTDFFERKVNKLIKIKLRSGREIKLTPEHPLLTIKGWKKANELSIKSRIAVPKIIRSFGKENIAEHEIKLLAYFIAEGHTKNFVLSTNIDDEIVSEFSESIQRFNGVLKVMDHDESSSSIVKRKKINNNLKAVRDCYGKFSKGSVSKQIKSPIHLWLRDLGILGKEAKEKFVPDKIFRLTKEQIVLFLNRLFSCNGNIYKHKTTHGYVWEVSYSSFSEKLIRQVQHLLLRLGINSKLREKKIKHKGKYVLSYELVLGTKDAVDFAKEIGFYGKKKEKLQTLISESENIQRNPNVDTIPKEIWDVYNPQSWIEVGKEIGYSTPKELRSSINYASRQKLMQIATIDQNVIQTIASSDIFWDEIVFIEQLEGDFSVYDISIEGTHNFIANDIIVHNSYSAGVLAEELTILPEEIRQNLSVIIIDTMGIYWSMKKPNEQDRKALDEWGLKPTSMKSMKFIIPNGLAEKYRENSMEFDSTFTLACSEISHQDWAIAFGFSLMDEHGLAIQRAIKVLKEREESYSIDDIISLIENDSRCDNKTKDALVNRFIAAKDWGIFEKEGTKVEDFIKRGEISVIDISQYLRSSLGWSVRSMVIGLLSRRVFSERLMARKSEELETIMGTARKGVPMVWMIIDEAHQFIPQEGTTAATEPLLTLVKEGREPGISLVLITQMPNKLNREALAQTDLVISHKLTAESDISALRSIMQSYMEDDIKAYINNLPRVKGAAIVMDDNSEKIFTIQMRPRLSWHAGGSPMAIRKKSVFD